MVFREVERLAKANGHHLSPETEDTLDLAWEPRDTHRHLVRPGSRPLPIFGRGPGILVRIISYNGRVLELPYMGIGGLSHRQGQTVLPGSQLVWSGRAGRDAASSGQEDVYHLVDTAVKLWKSDL